MATSSLICAALSTLLQVMKLLLGRVAISTVYTELGMRGRGNFRHTVVSMKVSMFDFLPPTLQDWLAHRDFLSKHQNKKNIKNMKSFWGVTKSLP